MIRLRFNNKEGLHVGRKSTCHSSGGLIAGWLAGQIVRGTGYGIIADICIGIIGALIGSWLLPRLGVHLGAGIIAAIISATIGAVLLLIVLRLVNRRGRW